MGVGVSMGGGGCRSMFYVWRSNSLRGGVGVVVVGFGGVGFVGGIGFGRWGRLVRGWSGGLLRGLGWRGVLRSRVLLVMGLVEEEEEEEVVVVMGRVRCRGLG